MNVTCGVSTFFELQYSYPSWDKTELKSIKIRDGILNEKDTYWLIFNKDAYSNKDAFEYLLTVPGITIVYQSAPAINGNYGYGYKVRNFLLVFEYEKPVQSLPEVSGQGE